MDNTDTLDEARINESIQRHTAPNIKPGAFVSILAKPWEDFVHNMSPLRRDRFREFIWWGYKVETVNGDRVTISSVNAPQKIREVVPVNCLDVVEKRSRDDAPTPPPEPYAVGAQVVYLFNKYTIAAVHTGRDGKPEYDLTPIDSDLRVWRGDRVWHSAIEVI
jgi:hypothetical protein